MLSSKRLINGNYCTRFVTPPDALNGHMVHSMEIVGVILKTLNMIPQN